MVHVLSRSADGAKLPSVGICLNASKAESRLDMAILPLGWKSVWGRIGVSLHPAVGSLTCAQSALVIPDDSVIRVSGPKSFVDDLCTGHGVVLGRAATTLRSIETHPLD